MAYYKAIVSYDGTNYQGWQSQDHGNTIQDTIIRSYKNTFFSNITIAGASRTDSGVHALGQVIGIDISLDFAEEKLIKILNDNLPKDILIKKLQKCPELFNPRKNVLQKIYHYDISLIKCSPFASRYCWYSGKDLDLTKLKSLPDVFKGTHDFRSFCTGDDAESTIRTIDEIEIDYFEDRIRFIIKGQGFLRYMIRRLVGSMIIVAAYPALSRNNLIKALLEKNPQQSFLTAPACGLTLINIDYKNEYEI